MGNVVQLTAALAAMHGRGKPDDKDLREAAMINKIRSDYHEQWELHFAGGFVTRQRTRKFARMMHKRYKRLDPRLVGEAIAQGE